MKKHRTSWHSRTGATLAELGPAMIVCVPIVLTVFELAMLVNTVRVNDATAAEACRVAAAGDPTAANQRAQAIVDQANQLNHAFGSSFSLISVVFTPANILTTEANMVPYGGDLSGSVAVTTQVNFTLITGGQPFVFQAKKSYPFTFNVPNTAGGLPPAQ